MSDYHGILSTLLESGTPVVAVTIVDAFGSTPSRAGAKMLVTAEGRAAGTVGGGKLEARALRVAREMLLGGDGKPTRFYAWSLSKDIGMTCGGSVKVFFEAHHVAPWRIVVFGAGHVAAALVRLLVTLDCRVTCIDPRPEWLGKLPDSPRLVRVCTEDMAAEVEKLPADAFVLLMTMGHASDAPILAAILGARRLPYVGVIGSRAKAAQLKKDLAAAGIPEERREAFFCPVGLDLGSNEPEEIAISVAAQLLLERDRFRVRRAQPEGERAE